MQINDPTKSPLRKLRSRPNNARTHSRKQIAQIAACIERFGFTNPILVDEQFIIIAGHGRKLAAEQLGLREVPVIVVSGLSEAEKRALALADNKIADNAGWDRAILAAEIASLSTECEFDLAVTGFAPSEIDSLLGDLVDSEQDPFDALPEIGQQAVSRSGDLWTLGHHRLMCDDSRNWRAVAKLMGRETAAMVFTDPPYNVRVASIQGRGKIKHREFAVASGELTPAQFVTFLTDCLRLAANQSADGAIHFICMDWRHMGEMLTASKDVYSELKNLVVWTKTNAGQGSFYRSQHELVFVFKSGAGAHVNNFELGQHGRTRSNVWSYPGVNTFRAGRMDELTVHPTVKPVAMVADAMRDCSRRGDIVLDPFIGSGTTILAAERVGRRGFGLELDPLYVDAAIRRWQTFTKRDAILHGTRKTFDELAATRLSEKRRGAR
jgi:DNA modification methylase